jgi:hypothetical protein
LIKAACTREIGLASQHNSQHVLQRFRLTEDRAAIGIGSGRLRQRAITLDAAGEPGGAQQGVENPS